MIKYIIDIDKSLFVFLNNLGSERWDFFWLSMSNKIVMFCVITFTIIICCYKIKIKDLLLIISFFLICIGLTDFLHVHLFKNVFMRLRPCWESDILSQIRPLLVDCGGQYGFVSGHAANSTTMVVFLILCFNRMTKIIKYSLLIWVFLVSYSRIYLAKHYPLDVIFGVIFGYCIAVIVVKTYVYIKKNYYL